MKKKKLIDEIKQYEYNRGYEQGYKDAEGHTTNTVDLIREYAKGKKAGRACGRTESIAEFAETLKSRLTDAICQRDVTSITNLIDDVAEEIIKRWSDE